MIAVPVTLCAPAVNTLASPTVAALTTVNPANWFTEPVEVPTTPTTLTPPAPAVRLRDCAGLLLIVELKPMFPPLVVTPMAPPARATAPVNPIAAPAVALS